MSLLIAALTWDPGFRGFLTVVLGALILGGSVYLILATNSGWRLGFQLTLTALSAWMMIMGLVWAMYGIGYLGRGATWKVEEVNFGNLAESGVEEVDGIPSYYEMPDQAQLREIINGNKDLKTQFPEDPTRRAPQLGDLLGVDPSLPKQNDLVAAAVEGENDWKLLASSDKQTGEASAAASAYVTTTAQMFTSSSEFVVLDAWDKGGKKDRTNDSLVGRAKFKVERVATWPLGHPPHRLVIRLRAVVPTEAAPGQPPPTPVADEKAPVISVIMERDLGSRREPAIFLFFVSAIVFVVCVSSLHHRDKLVAEARAAAGA